MLCCALCWDLLQAFVSDEDLEDMEEHENVNSWPREMREAAEAKFMYGAETLQDKWAGESTATTCCWSFRVDGVIVTNVTGLSYCRDGGGAAPGGA